MLTRKDLPAFALIMSSWLLFIALWALFWQKTHTPDLPYWKSFVIWFLTYSTAFLLYHFVVRPWQGKPSLFPPFRDWWKK